MWIFQNPEVIFYHFFRIFNLDIFWGLILQKRIWSRYLVPITPTTVLSRSFWNFTGALRMVWRYACGFFRILKLFFITGFLLQYLGKWYRTNGPLVNLPIFNTSNKNKAGDIYSPWNLLVGVRNGHRPTTFSIFARPGPLQLFSVSKTQISSVWKEIQFKKFPLICGLSVSDGCPHWRVAKLLPKVDWPAKKVYSGRWRVFWRAEQVKMIFTFAVKKKQWNIIFGTALVYGMSIRNKCTHIFSSLILIRAHWLLTSYKMAATEQTLKNLFHNQTTSYNEELVSNSGPHGPLVISLLCSWCSLSCGGHKTSPCTSS